ncbi:hypothetical protein AAHH69_25135 [Bacillus toyonensis]
MQLDWEETPYDIEDLSSYLYKQLDGFGPLETVIASISGNAKKFTEIAESIFPKVEREVAEKATSNLLMLANAAKKRKSFITSSDSLVLQRGLGDLCLYKCKL